MTKEIMAKAIVLVMQQKMLEIQNTVKNSSNMGEIAKAYDSMAALVRDTSNKLDELEKK